MRKSISLMIGLMLAQMAKAQFLFNCVDQFNKTAARISLSTESEYTSGSEDVCDGGFGDPISCRDVAFEGERKTLSIELTGSSPTVITQLPVDRITRAGAAFEPWEYFKGLGKLILRNQEYAVYFDYAGELAPYQYNLKIAPVVAGPSSHTDILRCHKMF